MDSAKIKSMREHMTHEHNDTLSYYLQGYTQKASIPGSCVLKSINENGIEIEYKTPDKNSKRARQMILFPHPVTTVAEARDMLDQMRSTALICLGLSPYQVTNYRFTLSQAISLGIGALITIAYTTSYNPFPFNYILTPMRAYVPTHYHLLAGLGFPISHVFEYFFLLRPLLVTHQVPLPARRVWFAASMLCGYTVIPTFKDMVEEARSDELRRATRS